MRTRENARERERKRERAKRQKREGTPNAASRSAARPPFAADSLAAVRYTRGYLDLANTLSMLPASGPFGLKSISRKNRAERERERKSLCVTGRSSYNETALLAIHSRSTNELQVLTRPTVPNRD